MFRFTFLSRTRILTPNRRVHSNFNQSFLTRRTIARTTLGALTLSSLAWVASPDTTDGDDREHGSRISTRPTTTTLAALIRAYVVFSFCSVPWIVDASPTILTVLSNVPLVKELAEAFVRVTFFNQFVGGDTVDDCVPVLHSLRQAKQGVVFAYSVEDRSTSTDASHAHQRAVQDLLRSVDVAGDFEDNLVRNSESTFRCTWVAIKMSTLLPDPRALCTLSTRIVEARTHRPTQVSFPGAPRLEDFDAFLLSGGVHPNNEVELHMQDLRVLYSDLIRICSRAKERGIRITIDAEESWYQPAIELLTLALMREFNAPSSSLTSNEPTRGPQSQCQPLIYLTLQAYLRHAPSFLSFCLSDAKTHHYALGVKLVRGAYIEAEVAAHTRRSKGSGIVTPSSDAHTSIHDNNPSTAHGYSFPPSVSPDPHLPVWLTKAETDRAYDECARMLIGEVKVDIQRCRGQSHELGGAVGGWFVGFLKHRKKSTTEGSSSSSMPTISVIFGTHNWSSSRLILDEIVRSGIGEIVRPHDHSAAEGELDFKVKLEDDVLERLVMGQLYGMSDDLAEWLVDHTITRSPFVIRYLPYGPLEYIMPYLSRRAIENKSVLGGGGGAVAERRRASREIWRRIGQVLG